MKKKGRLTEVIRKCYRLSIIRYIFWGGCTTLLNLFSFYIFRKAGLPLNAANILSIILAVIFAYVVNSRFVFRQVCGSLSDHFLSFVKFIGARLATMVIEVAGLWSFVNILGTGEMVGKFAVQFVVIVMNYVFSKLFVFTGGKKREKAK